MRLTIRLAILLGIGSLACLAQTLGIGRRRWWWHRTGLNATGTPGSATVGFLPALQPAWY